MQAKALVDAYNKCHKNQVELTIVPNDDYVAKVGAAAGSGDLPDLFAADIVYVPELDQGRACSATSPTASSSCRTPTRSTRRTSTAGTYDGKKYVLPFVLDLSVMFWNKDLYKEAGLDPEKGPTTLEEFKEQALAVQTAQQAGHLRHLLRRQLRWLRVFTWFPMIWASGEEVMNAEGTESLLDGRRRQGGLRHLA